MTIEHAGPFLESALFAGARANVMFTLCNYADEYGECWPSYEAIATSARCARRVAIREIGWLAEKGVVEILKGDDRPRDKQAIAGRCNVFRVNLAMVRAMYHLVRGVKDAIGRDPKERYQAIRKIAAWAEDKIDRGGVDAMLDAAADVVAKGDSECSKGDAKGDSECAKGDTTSPYPSIEPSEIYPSARASARAREAASSPKGSPPRGAEGGGSRHAAAGGDSEGSAGRREGPIPGRAFSAFEAARGVMGWVESGRLYGDDLAARRLWPDLRAGQSLDGETSRGRVAALPWQGLARAAGWAKWALGLAAGEALDPPMRPVARLARALADPGTCELARDHMAARAEWLIGEATRARAAARAETGGEAGGAVGGCPAAAVNPQAEH